MALGRELPWRRVRHILPGTPTTATTTAAADRTAYGHFLLPPPCICRRIHTRPLLARRRGTQRASYSTDAPAAAARSAVVSWPTLAQRSRQQQQQDGHDSHGDLPQSRPQPSPGAILIEHLDRDLRSPASSPASASASSSSLSALVEPSMHYPHRAETHQSRHRHRQSVIRQARLEAIRQAQLRPLPDWRAMLRQLVANTPREPLGGRDDERFFFRVSPLASAASLPPSLSRLLEMPGPAPAPAPSSSSSSSSSPSPSASSASTWHRNGMSFALPDGSPSVDELLHGTDGSLWAILHRTGSYLELYRRSPRPTTTITTTDTATTDTERAQREDRPWLLTLSGTKMAVRRAAADVTRFAKDAVPVVVSADVRLNSSRTSRNRPPAKQKLPPPTPNSSEDAPHLSSTAASVLPPLEGGGPAEAPEAPAHVWNLVTSAHPDNNIKWRNDPVFHPYTIHHNAYAIPRPDEWTRDSLERYVAALVNSRPAPHLAAALYRTPPDGGGSGGGGEAGGKPGQTSQASNSHDRAVLSLLHGVLGDPAARRALSASAFKMALAFACERGEAHRPDARALFVRMEMAGLPADTETFNIMLASQVKTQDLRNFGATLLLMRGRGQPPDLGTWLLFLGLFSSEEVKRHILHAMHACGLLDSAAAVRRVAPEMVQHDAERALASRDRDAAADSDDDGGAFLDRFLAGETARYGQGWLTRKAAHRLLHVLGRHGRFADCHRLLDCMEQWHPSPSLAAATTTAATTTAVQPPSTHTFNTVLYHCQVQNSLRHGLAVVQRMGDAAALTPPSPPPPPPSSSLSLAASAPASSFVATPTTAPDAVTYQLLFDMAWQRRLPHVLGVLWHGACAARLTDNRMRQRVGRVLAGCGPAHTQGLATVFAAAGGEEPTAAAAATTAPAATEADRNKAAARLGNATANRLAARYAGWAVAVPLGTALREALALDDARLRARARARRREKGQAVEEGGDEANTPSWPPEAPMRIPLRRVAVAGDDQQPAREAADASAEEKYIEIRVV